MRNRGHGEGTAVIDILHYVGGGVSSGGAFSLTGTIGQPDSFSVDTGVVKCNLPLSASASGLTTKELTGVSHE